MKQTFDIRYHVDRRPWQVLGLSVLAGYLIGRMIAGDEGETGYSGFGRPGYASEFDEEPAANAAAYSAAALPKPARSWGIVEPLRDELDAIKAAAVAAVVSVAKDLLRTATASVREGARSIANEREPHDRTRRGAGGDLRGASEPV